MVQLSIFPEDVNNTVCGSVTSEISAVISIKKGVRPGLKDVWNAFMVDGAQLGKYDIPLCPTTAKALPESIITWDEAKAIYKKNVARKRRNFFHNAFVCFYIDDHKFDGPRGIWHNWEYSLKVLRHFAGAITPDFSTYQDFPEAIKIYATYRMRLYGYWLGKNGMPVINNVRWGTEETFAYCFEGIPMNSIVAIGTVGGSPRKLVDRNRFETGLRKMLDTLQPHTIIIYGSDRYKCFDDIKSQGINVVAFPSQMSVAFDRGKDHE